MTWIGARRSLLVLVATVAVFATLVPTADAARRPRSAVVHAGRLIAATTLSCDGTEDVAVIEDVAPWFPVEGEARTGAVVQELIEQGRSVCRIASTGMTYWRLKRHPMVVIASDQPQELYDRLFPNGTVRFSIQRYVAGGGILVANLADCGWWSGTWTRGDCWNAGRFSKQFLRGLLHVFSPQDDIDIAMAGHPIVTGPPDCPSGNCGALADAGPQSDLDGWDASTHGYFRHLPPGASRILVTPDVNGDGRAEPVLVEYGLGSGRVVASMMTIEWMYNGGPSDRNRKLLANELAYAFSLTA